VKVPVLRVPQLRVPTRKDLHLAAPLALAAPAVAQVLLMVYTMLARWSYPYDLEWMEGGMLVHALRLTDGSGIYVEPSIDFVPYLYTPLYPALLAALSPIMGISYKVARAISILATLGTVVLMFSALVPRVPQADRRLAWLGAGLAAGLYAATYPWVGGWYDIARGDSLYLFMAMGGLVAITAWARAGTGWTGHGRIAIAAALLALSFFCKQTGIFFVAAGGAVLLALNWKRVPVYVITAGLIGFGGRALLNWSTDGWFWTYAFQVHQTHDCNDDRFWNAFGQILWHFPAMTIVIVAGLVAVAAAAIVRRRMPRSAGPLLIWSGVFAVAILMGAVGIATMWSVNNAYIPAMATGALAAGAALPSLAGSLALLVAGARWKPVGQLPTWLPLLAGAGLSAQLLVDWWSPARLIPTDRDRERGDALIQEIAKIEGEVFVPFHPWYGHLAGKNVYTHRMGVLDMRYKPPLRAQHQCWFHDTSGLDNWEVAGIPEAFREARFAAIIWDSADKKFFDEMTRYYRLDDKLPEKARPRLFTGARDIIPDEILVPAKRKPPPPDARVLWDFEDGSYAGWSREPNDAKNSWGTGPVTGPLTREHQGPVRRYGGRYFATSMHGGDKAAGILTSPKFVLDGPRITVLMSGGVEAAALRTQERGPGSEPWLRAELWIGGTMARHAGPADVPSERMQRIEWVVPEHVGEEAQLVFVDASSESWGHLNIDEIWIWSTPSDDLTPTEELPPADGTP
jgi:hypothetical protein